MSYLLSPASNFGRHFLGRIFRSAYYVRYDHLSRTIASFCAPGGRSKAN